MAKITAPRRWNAWIKNSTEITAHIHTTWNNNSKQNGNMRTKVSWISNNGFRSSRTEYRDKKSRL